MRADWEEHEIEIRGDWTFRWLFLAPEYELFIDGESADKSGGPVVRPKLEALFEDDDGEVHHLEAELTSIIGFRPSCEISVDGDLVDEGSVRVQNFLNPFLMLFIIVATTIMLYLGPSVLRAYWPF